MGKPWGFSAQVAILCRNGRISDEKQWNDLHIYVKSRVIVYPQPRIHNSAGWGWSKVGAWHLLNMRLPIIIIIVVVVVVVIIIIVIIIIITFIL